MLNEWYLVIGGAGFLGSYIVQALISRGHWPHVAVYDLSKPGERYIVEGATYFCGDILNEDQLFDCLTKVCLPRFRLQTYWYSQPFLDADLDNHSVPHGLSGAWPQRIGLLSCQHRRDTYYTFGMPSCTRENLHFHFELFCCLVRRGCRWTQDPGICCRMSDPKLPNFGTYVRTIFRRFLSAFGSDLLFWTVSVRIIDQTSTRSRNVRTKDRTWILGQNVRIKQN